MLDWKYRKKDPEETPLPEQGKNEIKEETPEGFVSHHIKLLTFIVCMVAFLLVFGPISVFRIQELIESKQTEGVQMTQADVIRLSRAGAALTMEDLKGFSGELSKSSYKLRFYTEFDNYLLLAVEDPQTKRLSICTLTDKKSGDSIDILKEDVTAFFNAH